MNSNILNYIGMGSVDPAYYIIALLVLIIVLFIIVIVQGNKFKKLNKKYDIFMEGKEAKSMESEIMALFDDIRFLKSAEKTDSREIEKLKANLMFAYQKVGIVRYDAFREMGGKLSFSVALLNDKNDGFIINSVHSSDGCYTYTKEIVNGESYILLGEEENEALQKALSIDTHENVLSKRNRNAKTDKKKDTPKAPSKANDNIELDLEVSETDYEAEEIKSEPKFVSFEANDDSYDIENVDSSDFDSLGFEEL